MNSQRIIQLLDATLDPSKQKLAEKELKATQTLPNFSLALLEVVANNELPISTRLAGSLCFKNFVRSNWTDDDGNYKIPVAEVTIIKQELINMMIQCPAKLQSQLGEAISIIADSDFYQRWDTLVSETVSRLSTDDPKVNIGLLEVAHLVFQKWRPLYQSNDLYREINHVLGTFANPFVELLILTDSKIDACTGEKVALKQWYHVLSLLVKLFFDLSCHDMPPQFEQNLEPLSKLLLKYLSAANNPLLATDDDAETGIQETVKADICEAIELYTKKYDDEFGKEIQPFIHSVWNLLSSTGSETKYDVLISKALHFLTAVASSRHASIFEEQGVLDQIIEKVVIPNFTLRDSDLEMFEDEPIEFIRRDLEGSDTDSRRRGATVFLRKLLQTFTVPVTKVVMKYVDHFVMHGKQDWKAKDMAIHLYIAIAAIDSVTASHGVKTVNSSLDVVKFFIEHVANDLTAAEAHPISKVDAIKYLYIFRQQLTKSQWQDAFNPLIGNMGSSNYVVYTYTAIAVERVLFMTNDAGEHMLTRDDIKSYANDLLGHLFKLIQQTQDPAKMQENEFLMRCIMRVLIVLRDMVGQVLNDVLTQLIQITNIIKANPSNPHFYYYHFEALGALVRFGAVGAGAQLEKALLGPFQQILEDDVTEFIPYIFQILAKLLEANSPGTLPDHYQGFLGPLLRPPVWETRGNVPGCVRLLTAIIPRVTHLIGPTELMEILGIFQRLVEGKKSYLHGFDVLDSVVTSVEPAKLDPYFKEILNILYKKLDQQPSDSFKQRLVRFYHVVSSRCDKGMGADYFIKKTDEIQPTIFTPVYIMAILPTTGELVRPIDRKTAVVSLARTLTDSKMFQDRFQKKGWGFTCKALMGLLQNPPQVSAGIGDEVITEADVDDIGFGMGYTPLNTCKQISRDDFPEITDVKQWVREHLKAANTRSEGRLRAFAFENGRLENDTQQALAQYLQ